MIITSIKSLLLIGFGLSLLLGLSLSISLEAPGAIVIGFAGLLGCISFLKMKEVRVGSIWLLVVGLVAMVYFVIRSAMSPVQELGHEDLMLILPAGILYLTAGYAVAEESGVRLRQALAWVVVSVLLLHIGSCLCQLNGEEGYSLSFHYTGAKRSGDGRITGMYSYYGSFANFASIGGLLCICMCIWGEYRRSIRIFLGVVGVIALVFCVMSQSRSAAFGLALGSVVIPVCFCSLIRNQSDRSARRKNIVIGVILGSGVLVSAAVAIWVFGERSLGESKGLEVIFDSGVRLQFWAMAVEQWAEFPLFGGGSRSFSYLCFQFWSPNLGTESGNPEFVHNEYLQLLADYGVIGFGLIILLILGHCYVGIRQIKNLSNVVKGNEVLSAKTLAYTIAGLCGIVTMSIHIVFDFRTHLQSNLLLLVVCAVWVLPVGQFQPKEQRAGSRALWYFAALILGCYALSSVWLGGLQWYAGMPLIKARVAKEDGSWSIGERDAASWEHALKQSLKRKPDWRRSQRLGALILYQAMKKEGDERNQALSRAADAYRESIRRHRENPVALVNVASILTQSGRFEAADAAYKEAVQYAEAREHWFRTYVLWGELHRYWARELRAKNKDEEALVHYDRCIELYLKSKDIAKPHDKEWRKSYIAMCIEIIYYLNRLEKFSEAGDMITQCEREGGRGRMLRVRADYELKYGEYHWYNRRPSQAMTLFYQAQNHYALCKKWNKEAVDEDWQKNYSRVKGLLRFLKKAGIKPVK